LFCRVAKEFFKVFSDTIFFTFRPSENKAKTSLLTFLAIIRWKMLKLNGIVRSVTVLHPYSAGTVLSVIWLVRIFSEEILKKREKTIN